MTATHNDPTATIGPELATMVEAGQQALAAGDLEAACKAFTSVTDAFPDEAVGHNNLGAFWMGLGEYARAEEAFARASELMPENGNCQFNLALARFRQEEFSAAAEAFAAAAALSPDDAETLNNLGACRFHAGQTDLARHDLEAALQRQPNYPAAVLNLSDLELSVGRIDKAVGICQAYLDHHDDGAVSRQLLTLIDAMQAPSGRRTPRSDRGRRPAGGSGQRPWNKPPPSSAMARLQRPVHPR